MLKLLVEKSRIIKDDNRYISSFCQKIENIFYKGLRDSKKYFSGVNEPYEWMEEIAKDRSWNFPFQYSNSLYEVQKNQRVKSKLGKFRLLLRYFLVNRCLHAPVEYLVSIVKERFTNLTPREFQKNIFLLSSFYIRKANYE